MTHAIPDPPPGFDALSIDERLDYVQSLWDRIAAKPEEIPVPDWHKEILEERLADLRAHPDKGRPWKEVREGLRRKLREHNRKP
ncbi:MAG: addiction module protein [Thermodesulfobacteriota bacterium]